MNITNLETIVSIAYILGVNLHLYHRKNMGHYYHFFEIADTIVLHLTDTEDIQHCTLAEVNNERY